MWAPRLSLLQMESGEAGLSRLGPCLAGPSAPLTPCWGALFGKGWYAAAKSLQSCPTLCNPIDGSPPGSPVPGILQARTLEWVAISFSNAWEWKVKVKSLSRVWLFVTPWTAAHQAPLSMGFSRQENWSGVPWPSLSFKYRKYHILMIYYIFNAGDSGLIWVGTILWRRERQPTPVFLPGESHGQRSLARHSPWGRKELDTTERLTLLPYSKDTTAPTIIR